MTRNATRAGLAGLRERLAKQPLPTAPCQPPATPETHGRHPQRAGAGPGSPATPGPRVPPAADSRAGHRLGTQRTRTQEPTAHAPHAPPVETPADLGQSLSAGCGRCLGAAALVLSWDVLPVGDGVRVRTFPGLGSSASIRTRLGSAR